MRKLSWINLGGRGEEKRGPRGRYRASLNERSVSVKREEGGKGVKAPGKRETDGPRETDKTDATGWFFSFPHPGVCR